MPFSFVQTFVDGPPSGDGAQEEPCPSGRMGDVAPVSGRSGDNAAAALVDSTAAVAVPAPLVAAELAGSSAVGAASPAEGCISPVEVVVATPS